MSRRFATSLHLILVALGLGCAPDEGDAAGESSGAATRVVTYHDDVAPILNEHCAGCHEDGALAPFAVDDYATAVQWAAPIVEATQARTIEPELGGTLDDYQCFRIHPGIDSDRYVVAFEVAPGKAPTRRTTSIFRTTTTSFA